ncbi:methyltransferase domain-containing protein [Kitasatospora sp. NPDC093806]|uniref:class I SAM-dependent methyltransferase n=1 Tax=Kitasatospora sp. NPDC093806 TaxID=3155075 RepID=UPI00344634AA
MTTDQLSPEPVPGTDTAAADARPGDARLTDARPGSDRWFFLSEALRTFRLTGALAPSGADLVNALVVPATSRPDRPISVLEVGAGTGVVTRRLVRVLRAGDRLHVVEANPRFAEWLRADPELARRGPDLEWRLSACRVQDLPECRERDGERERERYDVIVSGLPFTNFEPEEVRHILDLYLRLLVPGGELTYFGYLGTSAARLVTSGPRRGARHRAVVRLLRRFEEEHGLGSRTVWRNVPPARAQLLRAPGRSRSSCGTAAGSVLAAGADGPAGGVAATAR